MPITTNTNPCGTYASGQLGIFGNFDLFEFEGLDPTYRLKDDGNDSDSQNEWEPIDSSPGPDYVYVHVLFYMTGVGITVLLMNVLIGVLSSNYERYEAQSVGQFFRARVKMLVELQGRPLGPIMFFILFIPCLSCLLIMFLACLLFLRRRGIIYTIRCSLGWLGKGRRPASKCRIFLVVRDEPDGNEVRSIRTALKIPLEGIQKQQQDLESKIEKVETKLDNMERHHQDLESKIEKLKAHLRTIIKIWTAKLTEWSTQFLKFMNCFLFLFSYHFVYYSVSLWPTLLFYKSLHLFNKIYSFSPILHFPHGYQQFLPTIFAHNFYPQYFHRFPQIFTDLHRFILPFSLYLSIFYSAPCLQDLHRSSTDLSKIFQKFSFLHPLSLGTWTVGHSGPLSSFPSPPFFVYLPYLHSSSQIFNRSSKFFFFSSSFIPYFLVSGQSVIPAHSPDLQAFPLFSYLYGSSQIFNRSSKTFILLSSLSSWYLDSRSFRPTLQIPKFFISSLFPTVRNRSSTGLPKISPPPSPTTWYLDSRSFRPTLQFSKSLHFLSYPYTSSQIFHRSSKKFFFLHPLLLSFWTVGHSGPLSSFPVPFFPLFPHSSSSIFH